MRAPHTLATALIQMFLLTILNNNNNNNSNINNKSNKQTQTHAPHTLASGNCI